MRTEVLPRHPLLRRILFQREEGVGQVLVRQGRRGRLLRPREALQVADARLLPDGGLPDLPTGGAGHGEEL